MALPRTPVDHHEYEPHIALVRDEFVTKPKRRQRRRRVVARMLAWLPKCRAILVHWGKEAADYRGLLKLACALLWFRRYTRLAATVARS